MRILILAAGYGTRLNPLTLKVAKPLIGINGIPVINFLMDKVSGISERFPVEELRIVANNKFYESFIAWQKEYNIDANIINDGSNSPEDALGAVKDISLAINGECSDWLILGGDNLFEDDLIEFIEFAQRKKPYFSIGLCDLKDMREASRFGIVNLNSQKEIINFQEKPKNPLSTLAACCVYFFPKESSDLIQVFISQNKNVDASGKYIEWLVKEKKVFGHTLRGKWIDIGDFKALRLAEKEVKENNFSYSNNRTN